MIPCEIVSELQKVCYPLLVAAGVIPAFKTLLLAAALTVQAKTFRWSRSVDISFVDITQNVGVNNTMHGAVYDTLVEYNSKTFKPEPSLATGGSSVKPTQLRLTLAPRREVQRRQRVHGRRCQSSRWSAPSPKAPTLRLHPRH